MNDACGTRAALRAVVSDELHDGWHPGLSDPRYLNALDHAVDAALAAAAELAAPSPES